MATKYVKLQDGDNLVVIVETPPTVSDPAEQVKGVAQVYRVVANSWNPTLELIPSSQVPQKLAHIDLPTHGWESMVQ